MEQLIESCTSETNTSEDWAGIIQVCEQASGRAREVVQLITKRLDHKNINVLLFTLTLANSLVQNCDLSLKQEICSRPFLDKLVKLVNSQVHVTVKNRILDLIKTWATDFKGTSSLDYMNQVYQELVSQGQRFPTFQPSPKRTTFSDKEKEEEELQLALAMSLSTEQTRVLMINKAPSPVRQQPPPPKSFLFQVRALYDFHPTESGELRLQKGDIVDVYDHTTFPDWWKGSIRGNVGIFPANYVEKIEASRGAEEIDEVGQILSQQTLITQLKQALNKADPLGHDYAENERLQQQYQAIVGLVPTVIKHATAKRKEQDELSALFERFSQACNTYQQLMNDYVAFQQQQVQPPVYPPYGHPQQGYQAPPAKPYPQQGYPYP